MNPINTDIIPDEETRKSILNLSNKEAREFLLKQESYCKIDLPPYFQFNNLLSDINDELDKGELASFQNEKKPRDIEQVNYTIFNNKDGRYAWRPQQLIHPALYVSLVKKLTEEKHWALVCEKFSEFRKNPNIQCLSIPVKSLTDKKDKAEQITHWWDKVEQTSIALALNYDSVIHTDITDCYGAIYTHSIAWAIHTKAMAKKERSNKSLLGNIIDNYIQDMCHGQTNGIPQGSVLMDLIAEIVLGYADSELTERIAKDKIKDYHILRYRDDYRIFVNSSQNGEKILKCLTEVMIDLGLKLNPTKTKVSNEVVRASIKEDKLRWMERKQFEKEEGNLQKQLLVIYNHSIEYPNGGSLIAPLDNYYKWLLQIEKCSHTLSLISIIVDIAFRNPRTYSICAAILSKLLSFLKSNTEKLGVIGKIIEKFEKIPNTGHIKIWLQRISLKFNPTKEFDEPLCKLVLVAERGAQIWNSEWISSRNLKNCLDPKGIINKEIIKELDEIVAIEEVELFTSSYQ